MSCKKNMRLIGMCVVMAWFSSVGGAAFAQEQGAAASTGDEAASQPQDALKKDAVVRISTLEEENKLLKVRLEKAAKEAKDLKQRLLDQAKEQDSAASQKARIAALENENKQLKDASEAMAKERQSEKQRLLGLGRACASLAKEKAILQAMCGTLSGQLRPPELVNVDERNFNKVVSLNLGYAYGNQGRISEAIREYRKALLLDSSNKDIHYNLGYLLAKQKKYKPAIEEYKQALKGSGQDAEVYSNLAVIYAAALQDQKTADEFYRKFLEATPKKQATP